MWCGQAATKAWAQSSECAASRLARAPPRANAIRLRSCALSAPARGFFILFLFFFFFAAPGSATTFFAAAFIAHVYLSRT